MKTDEWPERLARLGAWNKYRLNAENTREWRDIVVIATSPGPDLILSEYKFLVLRLNKYNELKIHLLLFTLCLV